MRIIIYICKFFVYCGESQLLQILTLHGGITPPVATEAQRQVAYYSNMLEKINGGIFQESFNLDPLSVSNAVLGWRDALVSAGWNLKSGETEKLKFIREMEPSSLPKGVADCWNEISDFITAPEARCLDKNAHRRLVERICPDIENFTREIAGVTDVFLSNFRLWT